MAKEDNPLPTYPSMLESAGVEGEVLAQFVIDTLGKADMSTFKVLKSSNDLFTQSIKSIAAAVALLRRGNGRSESERAGAVSVFVLEAQVVSWAL